MYAMPVAMKKTDSLTAVPTVAATAFGGPNWLDSSVGRGFVFFRGMADLSTEIFANSVIGNSKFFCYSNIR